MQKPHVCFVSESRATYGLLMGESCDKVGGAEVQQTVLASALQELGYTITFLVPDLGQPAKVVTPGGVTLVKIRPQAKGIRGLQYLDEIRRTQSAMGMAGADIYYQRIGGHETGICALYCKMKRKPFVFSVAHNNDLDGSAKSRLAPHYYALYKYGLKNATAIIAQTDDQVGMLKSLHGRNGVLIRSTFSEPDASERDAAKEFVLWVGNFKDAKRPWMLLDLAERLPQYPFVMVGGPGAGEQKLFEELKTRAAQIPNLQITGAVPYREVGAYFSKAFMFVNTSSGEGFPNTYVQSWARGIPVVGTFDADNLIARYGLGRHCDTLDDLVAGVDEFMRDEKLRISTGEHVLQYVQEHHSPGAVAAQYDELFMRLQNKRGRI